jgi:hypothetical protein
MEHFLLIFPDLVKNLLIYPDLVEKKWGRKNEETSNLHGSFNREYG